MTRQFLPLLAPVLLLSGCGARVQNNDTSPDGRSDAAENDGRQVQGSGGSGSPADSSEGGSVGGASDARARADTSGSREGSAGRPDALIGTGTRFCEDYRECFGLECRGGGRFGSSVCVFSCLPGSPCAAGELCLDVPDIDPLCFIACDSPSDCRLGFDCVDPYGMGNWACLPAGWVGQWHRSRSL